MKENKYLVVSGTVFCLVALLHLARLFFGWQVQVGTWVVPLWQSWCGLIVAGALSGWAFRLAARKKKEKQERVK